MQYECCELWRTWEKQASKSTALYRIQPLDKIFGTQMRVPLQHLHGLVTTDGSHLLIGQAELHKTGYRFMPQVVESEVGNTGPFQCLRPDLVDAIGAANTIAAGLSEKDQIRVTRAHRVINKPEPPFTNSGSVEVPQQGQLQPHRVGSLAFGKALITICGNPVGRKHSQTILAQALFEDSCQYFLFSVHVQRNNSYGLGGSGRLRVF